MKVSSNMKGLLQQYRQLSSQDFRCWLASTQVEMSFVNNCLGLQSLSGEEEVEDLLMLVSIGHHILKLIPEIPLPHATFNNFLAHVPEALWKYLAEEHLFFWIL